MRGLSLAATPKAEMLNHGRCCLASKFGAIFAIAAALLVAGCAAPNKSLLSTQANPPPQGSARILLMPPDIELSELTVGGLLEPNAAWTETARANVDRSIGQNLAKHDARIVPYPQEGGLADYDAAHVQIVKLHNAVGQSILLHKYVQGFALPTKTDKFDWTLGQDVAILRSSTDADYALFTYMRDSFASEGRVALMVFAAVLGVGVQTGTQVGFASLVDLNNGEIVWFNVFARQEGDLRQADKSDEAVTYLLSDIPL